MEWKLNRQTPTWLLFLKARQTQKIPLGQRQKMLSEWGTMEREVDIVG